MAEIILCFLLVLSGVALITLAFSDKRLEKDGAWVPVIFAGITMVLLGLPPLLN